LISNNNTNNNNNKKIPFPFQLVILIGGVNVIFEPKSFVSKVWTKGPRSSFSQAYIDALAEPRECLVIYNLKKMLTSDYPDSAVMATVDRKDKLIYSTPHYFMWWKYLEQRMVPNLESDFPLDLHSLEGNFLFLWGSYFWERGIE
jgi:hypothetical protein